MSVDISKFGGVLAALGVAGEVRELPEPAPTARAAAAQLGCDVGAIANSLVFAADGAPLLVMTSGAHRVETARVAALIGAAAVTRADARSVREWTGQPIGGVAPVAHPVPIRTLVDTWLARYDTIWAAAGHPHTVFPTTYEELLRITTGTRRRNALTHAGTRTGPCLPQPLRVICCPRINPKRRQNVPVNDPKCRPGASAARRGRTWPPGLAPTG